MPHILAEVLKASLRLDGGVHTTPLIRSAWLSSFAQGGHVLLKMESEQATGSFKARGSLNKVRALSNEAAVRGVVTASSGNHGLGVARALVMTGVAGTIVLPHQASPAKVQAIKRLADQAPNNTISLEFVEGDALAAEHAAIARSKQTGAVYISPYNDPEVIGGQGTTAVEVASQLVSEFRFSASSRSESSFPEFHHAFITVGGGGLVSGMGAYLKTVFPSVKVWGCLPEASPEMAVWVRSGNYTTVAEQATLSDASAGAPERDSITYELCRQLVDEFALVSEADIADAMRCVWREERKIVEGSAAVAVAAFLNACTQAPERFAGQTVVIVVCGGNVSDEVLRRVVLA